jgi:hypothetical protein
MKLDLLSGDIAQRNVIKNLRNGTITISTGKE